MKTAQSTNSQATASGLIRQLCAEDPDAWGRFAELYTPMVYRWSRQANLQMADAEDVTQEVFRIVSTRLSSFRPTGDSGSFRAWLWGISRNVLRQHFERLRGTPAATGGSSAQHRIARVPDILESATPPDDAEVQKSLVFRMLRLIRNDFEETTWQAFWRTTVENQTSVEVGRDLAMTAKAVRQAKFRVLSRLREEMQP